MSHFLVQCWDGLPGRYVPPVTLSIYRSGDDFAEGVVFPCLGSLRRPLNLKQLVACVLIPYEFLLLVVLQSLWFFGRRNDPVRESTPHGIVSPTKEPKIPKNCGGGFWKYVMCGKPKFDFLSEFTEFEIYTPSFLQWPLPPTRYHRDTINRKGDCLSMALLATHANKRF